MGEEEGEYGSTTRDWIEARWRELDKRDHSKLMLGCWALWEHRNKIIFEEREVDVGHVVKRVMDVLHETEESEEVARFSHGHPNTVAREQVHWQGPQAGYVKVNVDAGVKEGEGVSLGVVCRGTDRLVLWGCSYAKQEELDPHVAEAAAILQGMQEARSKGHHMIIVESDCLQVIDALKRKASGRSAFFLIIKDILDFCFHFNSVLWSYTSRVNNSVAHVLARVFPRVVGKIEWSIAFPSAVNTAIPYDLSLIQ